MFTHTIKNKTVDGKFVTLEVEFSDGSEVINETVTVESREGLRQWLKDRQRILTDNKELVADDTIVGTTVEIVPDNLTQAEKNFQAWYKKARQLEAAARYIEVGAMPADLPELAALKTKAQADFRKAYINKLI